MVDLGNPSRMCLLKLMTVRLALLSRGALAEQTFGVLSSGSSGQTDNVRSSE